MKVKIPQQTTIYFTLLYGSGPFIENFSVVGSNFQVIAEGLEWPTTGRRDGRPKKRNTQDLNNEFYYHMAIHSLPH